MRTINPVNNNGSIQLKFSVGGKRYSFNPIPGGQYHDKKDLAAAKAIATWIQLGILAGVFDPTLNRYRCVVATPQEQSQKESRTRQAKTVLEVWDAWVDTLELPAATKADHYEMIRRMLVKANPSISDIGWLTSAELAPSTYNKRLSYVKKCFDWAVKQGLTDINHYTNVKTRKQGNTRPVKPFSDAEIQAILTGFEESAPHYVPFVKFLFLTGVRISEAIGLRWCHVDFDKNTVIIHESLSKDRTGDGYRRIRKERKTGSVTHLTMNTALRDLLISLRTQEASGESLVFTTLRGKTIDSGNFREDYWVKVLNKKGIEYRKPHNTRHTLASHALEQGIPITGVAYLLGHADTRMVMRTYGHMVNRPELPQIKLT